MREREHIVAWLREMARTAHIGSCSCYQRGHAFRQAAEAIECGEHVGIDAASEGVRALTDAELVALGNLVLANALGRKSRDEERLRLGAEVAYGDADWPDAERLAAELRRRGVLP